MYPGLLTTTLALKKKKKKFISSEYLEAIVMRPGVTWCTYIYAVVIYESVAGVESSQKNYVKE